MLARLLTVLLQTVHYKVTIFSYYGDHRWCSKSKPTPTLFCKVCSRGVPQATRRVLVTYKSTQVHYATTLGSIPDNWGWLLMRILKFMHNINHLAFDLFRYLVFNWIHFNVIYYKWIYFCATSILKIFKRHKQYPMSSWSNHLLSQKNILYKLHYYLQCLTCRYTVWFVVPILWFCVVDSTTTIVWVGSSNLKCKTNVGSTNGVLKVNKPSCRHICTSLWNEYICIINTNLKLKSQWF